MSLPNLNIVTAIAGTKGTGKTWYVKESLKKVLNDRPVKVLIIINYDNTVWHYLENNEEVKFLPPEQLTPIPIIDKDDIPYWCMNQIHQDNRIMRTNDRQVLETLRIIESYASNITILIEEAGKHFEDGRLPTYMNDLLQDSKGKNVDTVMAFHYLFEIPKKVANKLDFLCIKKTGDNYNDVKHKVKNPKLKRAMELVEASQNKFIYALLDVGPG
jgi:Cdc6-like AAA superfamily ATPase